MDKFHLPVFHPEIGTSFESKETEQVRERIAKSFLKQHYPLTEAGRNLQTQIKEAVAHGDMSELVKLSALVPTVEQPRLELFEDLSLPPEQEKEVFDNLANVQITKGCRHKCTFCAAGAAPKVESMPFATVLKIAEKVRAQERAFAGALQDWTDLMREKTGYDLKTGKFAMENHEPFKTVMDIFQHTFPTHALHAYADIDWSDRFSYVPEILRVVLARSVTNYYDSDPFDFRDPSFLHEDGTPADFGDVCAALGSAQHPIHITTAGWPRGDKVAQRAAEKVVALWKKNATTFSRPRVSVNPYEATARRDLDQYREDIESAINTLIPIHPEALTFYKGNVWILPPS